MFRGEASVASRRSRFCAGVKAKLRLNFAKQALGGKNSLASLFRLMPCRRASVRGIEALTRASFVTALLYPYYHPPSRQCSSAPTLSWSCRGTAPPSCACTSLCTRCSAGKSTQSSSASSRGRETSMCARQSWAPSGSSPSTCTTPNSLTGKAFFFVLFCSCCFHYTLHTFALGSLSKLHKQHNVTFITRE